MPSTAERFSPEWWDDIQGGHGKDRGASGIPDEPVEPVISEADIASSVRLTDHGPVTPAGKGLEDR